MNVSSKTIPTVVQAGVRPRTRGARVLTRCMIGLIRAYQLLGRPVRAAVFGGWAACRFHPSCSEYAVQALRTYGALKGMNLVVRRLLRCHPFSPGGFDPVPGTDECSGPHQRQTIEPLWTAHRLES